MTKTAKNNEIVSVRSIHKSYGDFHALKGVSLSVNQGEVIAIIGPSGSGKSTFIRTINQLEPHEKGEIIIDGMPVHESKGIDFVRRHVGMVFQSFNLFPHLTVEQNITLAPMRVLGLSPKAAKDRARELLKKVGISEQARKYPAQLSGGQQQRVAIARALAMQPKIMLFDEPTSALDPEMISEVLNVVRELAKSGMTMLIVTHEMGFAREISDRIVFFDRGHIIEDCTPEKFFAKSTNERVNSFLQKILVH